MFSSIYWYISLLLFMSWSLFSSEKAFGKGFALASIILLILIILKKLMPEIHIHIHK